MTSKITTSLILDSITGCQQAYHLRRKLRTAYTGPCFKIRRSSDSAESDIYFNRDILDIQTLTAFLGGSTGYVRTLYDQSGNNIHLHQTNTSYQPYLYTEADGLPSLYIYQTYLASDVIANPSTLYTNDLHFFTKTRVIQFDAGGNESYSGLNSTGSLATAYGILHYYNLHVLFGGYDKFIVKASGAYGTDLVNIDNVIAPFNNLNIINHSREGAVMISKLAGAEIGRTTGSAGPIEFDANTKYVYGCDPVASGRNCYQRSYSQLQFNRRLKTHEEYAVNTFITNT